MTTTELGMPKYFSYSAISSYMQCGKAYELERIKKVPQIPAWWFVGGTAVHELTEKWDRENFPENLVEQYWREAFDKEFEIRKAKSPDVTKWRAAGRRSKANPDGEDYLRWMDLGPEFIRNYIAWRKQSGWALWEAVVDFDKETGAFQSEPAIELELDFEVGDWAVRGFIDRVFTLPSNKLVVVDLKSGSRMPDNDLQLGTYAVGMEQQYGVRPEFGAYYNPRKNKLSRLYDLSTYTSDYLASLGTQFKAGIKDQVFLPHKTVLCDYCSVSSGCASFGGKDAHLYDSMHPLYKENQNG
jgi:putative RecB family exonuclease